MAVVLASATSSSSLCREPLLRQHPRWRCELRGRHFRRFHQLSSTNSPQTLSPESSPFFSQHHINPPWTTTQRLTSLHARRQTILRVSAARGGISSIEPVVVVFFFLWVSSPSNQTLKAMKTYIERHLKRSGTLPLTCFVRLDGRYDKSLSRDIATTIAAHLSRWRRMEFWFDVDLDIRRHDAAAAFDRQQDDEPVVDTVQTEEHLVPVPPPHTINLFTEELGLLEDLRLNLRTRYDIVGRSLQTPGLLSFVGAT